MATTRKPAILFILMLLFAVSGLSVSAATPGFGELYYEDQIVRTVVPPAKMKKVGVDPLYAIPDQRAVVAVAPGDTDYHGGKWAFHSVTWLGEPYLLTSADAVLDAAENGDIVITRVPENDFKCPIQP